MHSQPSDAGSFDGQVRGDAQAGMDSGGRDATSEEAGLDGSPGPDADATADVPPEITDLMQEPDTADNQDPPVEVRALALESVDSSDQSFTGRHDAGFYSDSTSNCAYISWNLPSEPVAGYHIYVRANASAEPILLTDPDNPHDIESSKAEPLGAAQTAYDICLDDLDKVAGLGNTHWDNGLSVELGVAALNASGRGGPIIYTTLGDNTAPVLARGGLGVDHTFIADNDTILLADDPACGDPVGSSPRRVNCPRVAEAIFGNLTAGEFGQRIVVFEVSEPLDSSSIVAANLSLVNGVLPTDLGMLDPNTEGADTEPEAAIADARGYDVQNGRTRYLAVLFSNFYGLDTGDRLELRSDAMAAVSDVAGNRARDPGLIEAPFVDGVAPMLKSVTLDAATDTVTAVFTEWISVTPSSNPLLGNIEASLFPFSNLSTKASLVSANHAINSGEARVTIALSDLGYLRGHNSSDAALLGGQGTRVGLDGVLGIDFIDATGQRGPANTTDTGNEAYVNVAPDVADPVNSPGAYGMRSSFADTIGPRLSRVPNESALPAASNTMVLGTEVNLSLRVSLTEKTADPTDSASAVSAANPANWAIKVIDLGGDGWAGNDAATDPALPGGTAAVSQVTSDTQTVLEGARYTLVIRFPATGGPTPTVGVAQITLSPAVTDLAGNVVDPATPHNVWTYNPSRVVGPNVSPGWDRN